MCAQWRLLLHDCIRFYPELVLCLLRILAQVVRTMRRYRGSRALTAYAFGLSLLLVTAVRRQAHRVIASPSLSISFGSNPRVLARRARSKPMEVRAGLKGGSSLKRALMPSGRREPSRFSLKAPLSVLCCS